MTAIPRGGSAIRQVRGLALLDVVLALVIISLTGLAGLRFWGVAERHSGQSLQSVAGYAAANSALQEALSQPFPACRATVAGAVCSFADGGLPPELAAAGWSARVTARLIAPTPAEGGGYAPQGDLALVEAVAASASGETWTLSSIQAEPSP